MKRKFLAALLALVMVFSMIPVSASAEDDLDLNNINVIRLMNRAEWRTAAFKRANIPEDGTINIQRMFIYDESNNQLGNGDSTGLDDFFRTMIAVGDGINLADCGIDRIVVVFTHNTETVSAVFHQDDFKIVNVGGPRGTKHAEIVLTEQGKSVPSGHAVRFYAELNDETTYTLYDTVYVQDGQQIGNQMPNDPPVGSYVFLGWQTGKDDGTAVGAKPMFTGIWMYMLQRALPEKAMRRNITL